MATFLENRATPQGARVAVAHGLARRIVVCGAVVVLTTMGVEKDADACGACFVGASESTVVSDHRMAFAFSKEQTILWDQIEYSGNPKEFAYVIPAKAGTRIDVSNEEWFAALEASTRPIIMTPQSRGGGGGGYGGYGGGGAGYGGYYGGHSGGGGCCSSLDSADMAAEAAPGTYADAGAQNSSGDSTRADPVQVISQEVVGSYETVTLRSTEPEALQTWLIANGFNIPESAQPILTDYVKEGLDFIAMRLRPSATVRAMEPIRIITPGADTTLPLRMMRIGAGPKLGITLFILGEGRYHPQNFPDATLDVSKLIWDYAQKRSNYQELSLAAMAENEGRAWLTEYAKHPDLVVTGSTGQSGFIGNPGLADAYASVCPSTRPYIPADAGDFLHKDAAADVPAAEGGSASNDAASDATVSSDAAFDASGGTDGSAPRPPRTSRCDDLDLALTGLHPSDVWLTRMRAVLPNAQMETPLKLEPTASQTEIDNVHYATTLGTLSAGLHLDRPGSRGTWVTIVAASFLVWSMLRGRRKE